MPDPIEEIMIKVEDQINYTLVWWPNWEQTALMFIPLISAYVW